MSNIRYSIADFFCSRNQEFEDGINIYEDCKEWLRLYAEFESGRTRGFAGKQDGFLSIPENEQYHQYC